MPLTRKQRSSPPDLPAGEPAPFAPDLHDARHLWLKGVLLLVWVLVSFVACFFARDLTLRVGGWQLGYWMAVQGAVLAFIVLVVVYCAAMSWFERQDARATAASADRGHA